MLALELAVGRESTLADRVLGSGLRFLVGLIGAAALGAGLLVAATEVRYAYLGSPPVPTVLAGLVAGVVALSGGVLLRGAFRGRIAVRSPRGGGGHPQAQ